MGHDMKKNTNSQTSHLAGSPALTRRALLAAAPAAAVFGSLSRTAFAQGAPGIRLQKINCFELRSSDVERTVALYQELFGMPVQSRHGGRVCLRIGEGPAFMAVRPLEAGETPAFTYIGYSVEGFDVTTQQAALNALGYETIDPPALSAPGIENTMKTWVRMRGDTPELYFSDARGLIVQLSGSEYCGGTGPLGADCAAPETVSAGLFALNEINHFTVFCSDGDGANKYYQDTFGLKVQAYQGPNGQGPNGPVTGIGDGYQFVMYAGGTPPGQQPGPANIDHGCMNMHGFNVENIIAKLESKGFTKRPDGQRRADPLQHYVSLRMPDRGGVEGGTPELYFTDHDGLSMQLQDPSYCGGGGYLGNECLRG
jgi:catechol 2,3-dioxygenase-like lactoylglutathione lyase family enzyme